MKLLKIKKDPKKGRGVYAGENIRSGETIEISQLLLIPKDEVGDYLSRYVFHYNNKLRALPLGNGSLFNHSLKPNVTCYFEYKKQVLVFKAKRPIQKGEELLIDYGYTEAEKKLYRILD